MKHVRRLVLARFFLIVVLATPTIYNPKFTLPHEGYFDL